MHQFIHGSAAAFADLEERALRACVVFQDQELPLGANPSRARIGFEINPSNGCAKLLVDRGVAYRGADPEVRTWLQNGENVFASFEHLKQWIFYKLAPAYRPVTPKPVPTAQIPPELEELTDLNAVQEGMVRPEKVFLMEEDELFRELSGYVRGQDQALRTLAQRVCRHIARPAPRRPSVFFAIGPTGVGKTKTAESLPLAIQALDAEGAAYSYLRLDMSEYQERYRVSQLLGAPPGYVGYGDGAQLVDALAANAKMVVLFDEIEKAHPDVLKALMNAMDAGRLSVAADAGQGREIDCRAAIFLFTTNMDANGILKELTDRNGLENPALINHVCRNHLRAAGMPSDLIGRIGCFLIFRPLSAEARAEIVTLAIVRVAEEYGLHVEHVEPQVIVRILEEIQSEGFGARPYEFAVDDLLGAYFVKTAAFGEQKALQLGETALEY